MRKRARGMGFGSLVVLFAIGASCAVPPSETSEQSRLGESLDVVLDADARALGGASSALTESRASDAWKMRAFTTDLAVSVGGVLGVLAFKGTPSVSVIWRKQGQKPARADDSEGNDAAVTLAPAMSRAEIARELEPAIASALARGKIQDEVEFRRNISAAAEDFRSLVSILEHSRSDGEWWVSRYRLDLMVEASGKVGPFTSVGAETRIRFEWHRLMKKVPGRASSAPALARGASTKFFGIPLLAESVLGFADAISEDIRELSSESDLEEEHGFRSSGFRVGLGISLKGDIGIAKFTTSLYGHLYYSRDVAKPVVYPPMVFPRDRAPGTERLALIGTSADGARADAWVVEIKRDKFRKGLKKALKMGASFAKRAAKDRDAATHGKWKVYELKTGIDISVAGEVGAAELSGIGTAEIAFYNSRF